LIITGEPLTVSGGRNLNHVVLLVWCVFLLFFFLFSPRTAYKSKINDAWEELRVEGGKKNVEFQAVAEWSVPNLQI